MNNDPDANIPCFSAVLIIETINTHKCFEMQIQSPVCPCCDDWCYVGSIQLLRAERVRGEAQYLYWEELRILEPG